MFEINDVVVYGAQGVCEIIGIEDRKIDGEIKKYFVLKPKNDKGATCYVPTWNEKAWGKMRKVMTKEDVNALIDSMPCKNPTWTITKTNEKKYTGKHLQAVIKRLLFRWFKHFFYIKNNGKPRENGCICPTSTS
jgi:CarD family transcriptional regulator